MASLERFPENPPYSVREERLEPSGEAEKETSAVRPEWFKAYVEGNLTMPQTYLASILLTGEALLADRPDFEAFCHSRFTSEQLDYLKLAMNRAHGVHAVGYRSADHPDVLPAWSVRDDDLHGIWEVGAWQTLIALGDYAVQVGLLDEQDYEEEHAGDDEELYDQGLPRRLQEAVAACPEAAARMRTVIGAAAAALRSPEIRPLLAAYRKSLRPGSVEEELEKEPARTQIHDDIKEALRAKVREADPEFDLLALPSLGISGREDQSALR